MSSKPKTHRRRTEDEMRYALSGLAQRQQPQRDDDWEQVLDDAIYEVLAWRRIGVQLSQDLGAATSFLVNSIKNMGQ